MNVFINLLITVAVIFIVIALISSVAYNVRQQTNVIIERFGKFNRIAEPGLRFKIPLIERKAGVVDLRVLQLDLPVETKTKDNVFVNIAVSVQYNVNPTKVYDAFYKLSDHERQISSYVYDSLRSAIPSMELDLVFEKKEDIAKRVAETIGAEMSGFGYSIVQTLIADINPNEVVKNSMNEINAAQRARVAAQELAEAERIRTVTNAEALAEAQKLAGRGISDQRQEIIDGFTKSIVGMSDQGIDQEQVVQIILYSQYLDTIADLGKHGNASIMVPGGAGGANEIFDQIRTSVATGSALGDRLMK